MSLAHGPGGVEYVVVPGRVPLTHEVPPFVEVAHAVIDSCPNLLLLHFPTNGYLTDKIVENTRASLPPVSGGQRVGFVVYGPAANLFVDRAECRLAS